MTEENNSEKYAIRFGLGAIKAVGLNVMEIAIKEREENGKFKDIYDFAQRLDPKSINKKSIEALAKSGAFDSFHANRRQLSESFDILSAYSALKSEESSSNQMSLFGGLPEADLKPELKKIEDWPKVQKLQREFEAFGYFLNEHPLDGLVADLRRRGVIFSEKLERDELEDGNLVKMAGVVAGSKHRSSARGRFAYMSISEAMIFDESIITSARDILADGSIISLECLIKKDDGGTRILVRDVKKIDDFINSTKAEDRDFEDIKKQHSRNNRNQEKSTKSQNFDGNYASKNTQIKSSQTLETKATQEVLVKKNISKIEILVFELAQIHLLKSILNQCTEDHNFSEFYPIILLVSEKQKITKIELPKKYFLTDLEIARLKNISGIKVELFF